MNQIYHQKFVVYVSERINCPIWISELISITEFSIHLSIWCSKCGITWGSWWERQWKVLMISECVWVKRHVSMFAWGWRLSNNGWRRFTPFSSTTRPCSIAYRLTEISHFLIIRSFVRLESDCYFPILHVSCESKLLIC